MKNIFKKISSHLKDDISGYKKERKYLKKEEAEDRSLIKKIRGKTNGSTKSIKTSKKVRKKVR